MRIETAFVSRYPDDFSDEFEPLVCLLDGRSQEPAPARFPAHALFPDGAYRQRRHTALVFPLVGKTQQVGVAVFDYSGQAVGQQLLRDQISAALGSIRLYKEMLEKTVQGERSLHDRMAAAKRMQSLSVLAGGVAHDLNNALGPLVALPDVILRDLEGTGIERIAPELRTDVESIKSASLRAAQTIKDLLTLGRQGKTTKELIDLGQTVANCLTANNLRFLKEANNRVKVVVDIPRQPLIVRASEAHLVRAITNLVRNAVEAIPGEGEVTVKVVGLRVVEATSGYETVEPGDYAVVTAKDNGRGIPSQDISRVFEPFFSKKRLGDHSGSGLGLSVVHGVVKEHEGFVDVTSTEGVGTTFTLYFPCAKENARLAEPNTPMPIGHAKVLIVDDEAIQRRTGYRVLSHLGYQVDTVESGLKAYQMFKQAAVSGHSPYDLVILDMNLYEDRDGLAYCQEIQKLFPAQKAIVTSGHAPSERAELAVKKGLAWLAKPYTTETLANAVQAALSARPRPPQ
jgi:signal transduction histidine kinase/ActR/RegA family two-component response regulator